MSSRRPSTDSPRSTEAPAAKKAPPRRPRTSRTAAKAEKKEAVSVAPAVLESEPREPLPVAPVVGQETAVVVRELREPPLIVHEPAVVALEPTVVARDPPLQGPQIEISPDARRAMVAEAAYLRAERRGFAHGNEVEDWLAAEAEVDQLLQGGRETRPQ